MCHVVKNENVIKLRRINVKNVSEKTGIKRKINRI